VNGSARLMRLCLLFLPTLGFFQAKGDVLNVGYVTEEATNVDPAKTSNYESVFVMKQISQSLVEENRYGSIVPGVARYWTISADMKTYHFYIQPGIQFHNHEKMTAYDVEFSLNLIKSSIANPISFYLKKISKIRVLDENHVAIELESPWLGFLQCLSSGLVPILSRQAYIAKGQMLGSGSYKIVKNEKSTLLVPFEKYKGNYPPKDISFRLLTKKDNETADIVLGKFSSNISSQYKKTEIDSFITYVFVVNPNNKSWRSRSSRLYLARVMLEAKKIITSGSLRDLVDIIPNGMLGHDMAGDSYFKLVNESEKVDLQLLNGRKVVVGSYGPLPKFKEFSKFMKSTYNIDVVNKTVNGSLHFSKMRSMTDVDFFAVGWASVFSHPDGALLPYYQIGIQKYGPEIATLLQEKDRALTLPAQYVSYRKLTSILIRDGYMVPHAQQITGVFTRSGVHVPMYRYRYTMQLSEIKQGVDSHD
jgi:ABC-type transport system substrate-binding protein